MSSPTTVVEAQPQPAELYGTYIVVATLGMFVWDVLTNLSDEYRLLLKRKIGWPTVVYALSRVVTGAGLIGAVLVFAFPIGRFCSSFAQAILFGFPVFIALEGILLFFRLRAVYMDKKRVVIGSFIAVLVTAGCSALIPFVGEAYQIGPANAYCGARMKPKLGEVALVVPLLGQMAMFFAVSFRLMPTHILEELRSGRTLLSKLKIIFCGKHLPSLTKTMFVDGQRYILIFLVTTIVAAVVMGIEQLPDIYRFILIAPHVAIENSMNCYLFRSVRKTALKPSVNELPTHFLRTTINSSSNSTIHFNEG